MDNSPHFLTKTGEMEGIVLKNNVCNSPAGVVARQIKERVVAKAHPKHTRRTHPERSRRMFKCK